MRPPPAQGEAGRRRVDGLAVTTSDSGIQPVINLHRISDEIGLDHAETHQVLTRFVDNFGDLAQRLPGLLESDPEAAHRMAHSLKGISGNLGFDELFEASRALDTVIELRAHDLYHPSLAVVATELGSVVGAIRDWIAAHPIEHRTRLGHLGREALHQRYRALLAPLGQHQALQCRELILELGRHQLDDSERAFFERLRSQVAGYRYKEASKMLREHLDGA